MAEPTVRRADFLMTLAYATDLATGQSRDFALRSCVLAMRLAEAAGLDEDERRNVFHQALLRYIGCNADTHLLASAFGDEIALRQDLARIDLGNHSEIAETFVRAFTRVFKDAPPAELAAAVQQGLAEAMQVSVPILAGHCEVAQRIGERIGLSDEIRENLGQLYERWDGNGLPRGLKGDAVKLAVRLVTLAQDAIVLAEADGQETMAAMITKRRGGAYEEELADLLLSDAAHLLEGLDGAVDRETILALTTAFEGVLNHIYAGIDVDMAGLDRVRAAARNGTLVLLPSRKSHMDYLILSYVLHRNSLQLPLIAAGDNLSFFPAGYLLGRAGGFFIRRSFKGDRLYVAVVDAYLRRLLRDGWPIEFFLEGARSRT